MIRVRFLCDVFNIRKVDCCNDSRTGRVPGRFFPFAKSSWLENVGENPPSPPSGSAAVTHPLSAVKMTCGGSNRLFYS